jgi:DNA polymerase III sliding clamp (beta) subunit (PCNA family)
LTVDSEDILFNKKAKEEVACTVEGAGITIGVKGSSLVDCLSAVDGDSVVMELDEVRKPINIYDPNCPNKALMVCPLVLNN